MKRTIDVNLGGSAFTIDEDAYQVLKNYLDDVSSRLPKGDEEVINDVEARIAEILQNHISLRSQVVDTAMVRNVLSVMGRPEEFGEKTHINEMRENRRTEQQAPRRLYRNLNDRWFGGVCSGLAAYFGTDASVIRLVTFLLVFLAGLSLWVYIIFWIVVPRAYLNEDGTVDHF